MTDLSPAADAVLDAYMNNCGWLDGPLEKDYRCAAAVLRAAADQVAPDLPKPTHEGTRQSDSDIDYWEDCQQHRANLLAIADELEGVKYGTYRCDQQAK